MDAPDLEQIYSAYQKKVMGYIRARINSWADAEDLCADVFEKIARKLPDFDSTKASLSTWVFTITRNTVIDYFRRSKPSEEIDENIPEEGGVDDALLNTETLSELAIGLQQLPQIMRDIIVLRYYHGKPLTEIAQLTGLSYGAVKLRHQSALLQLKQALENRIPGASL